MNFPLNAFNEVSLDSGLLISLLVGLGFGAFLEKGGFGSSKVLAGIFYGRDWRVLKVMFSAIVTAMVGLYAFDGLGLLAMDQIAFKSTYIWAQIVGGLILGVGFVTAGYCPGTAVVGTVSGKLDAVLVILGVIVGIGVFEEGYPLWKDFYNSGYMGELSIQDWIGVPAAVVMVGVAVMAFGAFAAVEFFERGKSMVRLKPWIASVGSVLLGAGMVGVLLQAAGPGEARAMSSMGDAANVPSLQPIELAGWSVEERVNFMVFDLRPEGAVPAVAGSYALPAADLIDLRRRPSLPADRVLVIVDEADDGVAREVTASLRRSGLNAICLAGGAQAFAVSVLSEDAVDPRAVSYRILASGESPFGGAAPPAPTKARKAPPARKKKKSTGCS